MKTIDGDKARWIIEKLFLQPGTALFDFCFTGVLKETDKPLYYKELNEMLSNKPKYLKKDYDNILKLKKYFDKWAPVITREPANIKTLEYTSSVPGYEYENTIFDITWNELIIYFPGEHSKQSISLKDAKLLALEILKY